MARFSMLIRRMEGGAAYRNHISNREDERFLAKIYFEVFARFLHAHRRIQLLRLDISERDT